MGYYTRFELAKVDPPEMRAPIYARLRERSRYHDPFADEVKWYDHEIDAAAVSIEFPAVRFEITGIGEDGDMWTMFAHGGRVEKVQARIEAPAPGWYGISPSG